MNGIQADLLTNTYHLIQLARETAIARGNQEQAERLAPLTGQLHQLVSPAQAASAGPAPAGPAPVSGVMAQSDFQKLLSVVQTRSPAESDAAAASERHPVVQAMSSAGMSELDIARHMGMTRQEVHLVLSVSQAGQQQNSIPGAQQK